MSSTSEPETGRRRKDDPLGVGVDTPTLIALTLGAVGSVATANLVMGDPIGRWLRGMQEQQQAQQNFALQQQEYQRQVAMQQQQQQQAQQSRNGNGQQQYYYGEPYVNPYANPYTQQDVGPSPPPDNTSHVGENSINMAMAQPTPAQEYLGDPTVAEYVQRQIAGQQNIPLQGSYTHGVREKSGNQVQGQQNG